MCVLLIADAERFPAKVQVNAPPVVLRRDNFEGRGTLKFSAACGLLRWRPVDWNCVVFVVLVEVQKGQKTPLVACAVLEPVPGQAASVSRVTD